MPVEYCPGRRSSHLYTPTTRAGVGNRRAPASTTDLLGRDRASGSRRLPTISASRPSSLTPSRQSFCTLSLGSHQPARVPDPGAPVAPPPGGPPGSASPLGLASLLPCV